jgi:hypothetical protein
VVLTAGRVQLLDRAVLEGDVEDDVANLRLRGLVVKHVDHCLRAGEADVLAVDGPVLLRPRALHEVGARLLVAVAEDPLGVAAGVVVLLVARVERKPVRVVDVRHLVARLLPIRVDAQLGLDRNDHPVVDRDVEVDAVSVPAGRHRVRAVPEAHLLDRAGRLRDIAVAAVRDRVVAGLIGRLVLLPGGAGGEAYSQDRRTRANEREHAQQPLSALAHRHRGR